jgi:hypothetical protein
LTVLTFLLLSSHSHDHVVHDNNMRVRACLQREAIIENHTRRRAQLQKLLNDTKEKVAAHEEGRSLLEGDDQYETLKKRIGLYEKKVRDESTDILLLLLECIDFTFVVGRNAIIGWQV